MMKALTTSATGLEAQQANLERISNDLANVNTDGYKKSNIEFKDLMYETVKAPGDALGAAMNSPVGVQKGLGVKVGASHKDFTQGAVKKTDYPFDLMIEGKGFFAVSLPNTGEIAYTRQGAFKLDSQARICKSDGALIEPPITVPTNAASVIVGGNGEVKAITPEGETVIGQIQLVNFVNPQGLLAIGGNYYKSTPASGTGIPTVPGENNVGTLAQGMLETSNVNVASSMIEMIGAQRAYEMNTKVMGVADKMLEATTSIVR